MGIIENEIWAFVLGAAAGSIVTYYIATKEKRIVSKVRRDMSLLGSFHKLTQAQHLKNSEMSSESSTRNPNESLSDARILKVHDWARRFKEAKYFEPLELDPTRLAAEAIICEELLELTSHDAITILKNIKYLHEIPTVLATLRSKPKP